MVRLCVGLDRTKREGGGEVIVYIVQECCQYEGCTVYGPFSSREKAALWIVENLSGSSLKITPFVLDHPEQDPTNHLGGAAVEVPRDVGVAQVVDAGVGETGAAGDLGAPGHDGGGGDGEDATVAWELYWPPSP